MLDINVIGYASMCRAFLEPCAPPPDRNRALDQYLGCCRGGRSDGVPSAEGCYMNFIQLVQGIILPTFGHRKDDKAREVIESLAQTRQEN